MFTALLVWEGNLKCHLFSTRLIIIFRAPVLVAISLIEQGMSSLDSVQFIRERRRGAINNKQIEYIEAYRRQSKGKCIVS